MTLTRSPDFAPRAQFSISQIEKAFGHGYELLTLVPDTHAPGGFGVAERRIGSGGQPLGPQQTGSDSACLRAWGLRYLAGLKEPELTWAQACALPEGTDEERRYKAGAKARTWGKVAEVDLERYIRRDPSVQTKPLSPHVVAGLALLPHPTDLLDYEFQAPVNVRTTPEAIAWGKSAIPSTLPGAIESVTWQGFKDFRGRTRALVPEGQRFLIDFKTTKPKVDNEYNAEHNRPPGTWRYRKLPEDLRLDWQYNLYQWDEYLRFGELSLARWVYFASPGSDKYPNRPEACASDMAEHTWSESTQAQALAVVRDVVRALDARGRVLLGHVRETQALGQGLTAEARAAAQIEYALSLPANVQACEAFGGCPHSERLGGHCKARTDEVIPVGRLIAGRKPRERTTPAPTSGPVAQALQFSMHTFNPEGNSMSQSVLDQIQARIAANQAAAQPPAQAPIFPGGQPVTQAASFTAAGAQAPGFQPPFQPQAFPAAPPVQAPPPPPGNAFGAPAAPGWLHNGEGGYFPEGQLQAMAAAGHPQAQVLLGQAPAPAAPPAFVPPSPTPGLPPEAFAPGGPMGPALVPAPVGAGSPVPPPLGASPQAEAPKKGRGRPRKDGSAAPAGDTEPAPAPDGLEVAALGLLERLTVAVEQIARKIGA